MMMAEKKMSLMKLDESILELQAELEAIAAENEGEIPEEKLRALIEVQAKVPEKLKNIVSFIRYTETIFGMYGEEKKRMDAKRKIAENTTKNIKKYIQLFMEVSKLKKVNAVTADITLVEKKAIEIEKDELKQEVIEAIPDSFCRFTLNLAAVAHSEKVIAAVRAGLTPQISLIGENGEQILLDGVWSVTREANRDLILDTLKANNNAINEALELSKKHGKAIEIPELLKIPGVRLIDNNHIMIK